MMAEEISYKLFRNNQYCYSDLNHENLYKSIKGDVTLESCSLSKSYVSFPFSDPSVF